MSEPRVPDAADVPAATPEAAESRSPQGERAGAAEERLRLFFGLPVPAEPARAVVAWQRAALRSASGVRVVPPAMLHVTLAFLGSRPATDLDALREALREAAYGSPRPALRPLRYRETERVAMLVCDDEEGRAAALQDRLATRLEAIGVYERERRPWLAHLTVARFRSRPRLRPALTGLEPFSPPTAALYVSVLRPAGAQYEIIDAVELG